MDFAVACRGETPFFQKTPSASAYLVSEFGGSNGKVELSSYGY